VPIQAEFFALQGMGKLMEVVQLIRSRLNPLLKVTGIIVCMFRSQTNLAKEVLDEVEGYFGDVVFNTKIRQNIRLAEAASHGTTIFEYEPQSIGALDYWELAEEILAQEKGRRIAPADAEASREQAVAAGSAAVGSTPVDPGAGETAVVESVPQEQERVETAPVDPEPEKEERTEPAALETRQGEARVDPPPPSREQETSFGQEGF